MSGSEADVALLSIAVALPIGYAIGWYRGVWAVKAILRRRGLIT